MLQSLDASKSTGKEKEGAIASLIFQQRKKDGTWKSRQCADGRKQQEYMLEEVSASLTMSTEAIL